MGSPPHGRGKAKPKPVKTPVPRITPAWAGKRALQAGAEYPKGDHPRMGGEKYNSAEALANRQGSPPHGRGKGSIAFFCRFCLRITPAWAGKSALSGSGDRPDGDHPRMGGEKAHLEHDDEQQVGSPPHGRGKVVVVAAFGCCRRITPAWAGKSSRRRCVCRCRRDHPRMGGEKPSAP